MGLTQSSDAETLTAERTGFSLPWRAALEVVRTNRIPLIIFSIHTVLVFAVGAFAISHFYALNEVPAIQYRLGPMSGVDHYLVQPLRNWDGYWYSLLANYGYGIYTSSAAFWPLYPLLLWVGAQITNWDVAVVGLVISNVSFLFALILLYRLVRLDFSEDVARRTIWLTAFFPTAFYFSALYTESLFLLVTVASIYYGRTGRWGRASIALGLAALTRNTGVLVIIPLAIFLFRQYGWDPRRWWQQAVKLALGASTPLLFILDLNHIWGQPFLMLSAQKGWARYKAWPWTTLHQEFLKLDTSWITTLFNSPSWSTLTDPYVRLAFAESQFYDLLIFLVFVPVLGYTLWRVRGAYSLYALVVFVLPLFTPSLVHPLMSVPRFVIVLFPLFIALALLTKRRWVYWPLMAIFLIQFVALLIQFSTWFWVA
jgi:Gpi18-like mannosyltransferase